MDMEVELSVEFGTALELAFAASLTVQPRHRRHGRAAAETMERRHVRLGLFQLIQTALAFTQSFSRLVLLVLRVLRVLLALMESLLIDHGIGVVDTAFFIATAKLAIVPIAH